MNLNSYLPSQVQFGRTCSMYTIISILRVLSRNSACSQAASRSDYLPKSHSQYHTLPKYYSQSRFLSSLILSLVPTHAPISARGRGGDGPSPPLLGHFVKDFTKRVNFSQYSPPPLSLANPLLSFSVGPCSITKIVVRKSDIRQIFTIFPVWINTICHISTVYWIPGDIQMSGIPLQNISNMQLN